MLDPFHVVVLILDCAAVDSDVYAVGPAACLELIVGQDCDWLDFGVRVNSGCPVYGWLGTIWSGEAYDVHSCITVSDVSL